MYINILIVGRGTLLNKMKSKCKNLRLDNNITFTGHISHENIVKY